MRAERTPYPAAHISAVRAAGREKPNRRASRAVSGEETVYAFAVLRAVPHVYLGSFCNVGVIVHAPTAEFLDMRVLTDLPELKRRAPEADTELLARYLEASRAICAGDAAAGPLALAAPSERFHWITAPRSDVLQSSPVHEGVGDPGQALEELFAFYVERC